MILQAGTAVKVLKILLFFWENHGRMDSEKSGGRGYEVSLLRK
jgi:hypothetical protein